jgi:flagellar biosynthesis protein FlhG
MGAGIEKPVRILSSMASRVIVLCTDDPTSLTDAYAFIKVMNAQYPKCKLNVVVNQANSYPEGQRTYDTLLRACQSFLKISPELLGIIRRDTRVRDSIRNQTSLISRYPTSEAADDVISIARKLI